MKNVVLLMSAAALLYSGASTAQAPAPAWSKVYGGAGGDAANSIAGTPDGGFIVAGSTGSPEGTGDVSERLPGWKESDVWVVKLNDTGKIEWEKVYGGSDMDVATKIITTSDGGYAFVGHSRSQDGDVTANIGHIDIWIVKLNDTGKVEWERSFGSTDQDEGFDIKQTRDGGYIAVGKINTYVMPGYGNGLDDYLVIKLDASGRTEWEKPYGSSEGDWPRAVIQTFDGGYLVGGMAGAANGDVSSYYGDGDGWVIKLNDTGRIEWQKTIGGTKTEYLDALLQTPDSGYVIGGWTRSNDGNIVRRSPGANPPRDSNQDFWVMKVDKTGQQIVWNKGFGGSNMEQGLSISLANDQGLILAGTSSSMDYDLSANHGGGNSNDGYIFKIDADGNSEWHMNLGSSGGDEFYSVIALADGGYAAAGRSGGDDFDIPAHSTGSTEKFWVVRLEAPDYDSIRVATEQNIPAAIAVSGGTLSLTATIYPRVLPQNVTWSVVPGGTGNAAVNAQGIVTAQADGSVWIKAVSTGNASLSDSILVTISNQEPEPGNISAIKNAPFALNLYPNPTGGLISLQSDEAHPDLTLTVLHVDGRVIMRQHLPAGTLRNPVGLNLSQAPAGIYLIRLEGSGICNSYAVSRQ